ncbi:TlpA family protein disulfide reductase [Chondrinema litorale]|uniref:TlpA family protein disulfide reductase n=1 Tax=Chondrinema litorale TaxID=2994555 RepID=UPI00254278D7|nr:redoxin family protein [Chondrinema litorale]UZR98443.1 redoxin family protein [Chondrinema litorale]
MKQFIFILICLCFFTFVSFAQVVINGKIKNYDGDSKIHYQATQEGILSPVLKSKVVKPNKDGRFKIEYINKGVGTTRIHFKHLIFHFIHDENSQLNFEIDQNKIKFPEAENRSRESIDFVRDSIKQLALEVIEGDFAEINRFNNNSMRTSTISTFRVSGCSLSLMVQKLSTPKDVVDYIDSLTQIELTQINQLSNQLLIEHPEKSQKTEEIKQFLTSQVRAFYGSVFLNGMLLKRIEQNSLLNENPIVPHTIYNDEWIKLTEDFFTGITNNIKPTANSFEFNEFISNLTYTLENYKDIQLSQATISNDELVIERLLQPKLRLLDSLSLLDSSVVFAYKLENLNRFLNTQTFYSPTLLYAVHQMKKQFPNSKYFSEFDNEIEKLEAYVTSSSEQFDRAKVIETEYLHFLDLLEQFKGENVFIDVWATWCAPCVEDFKYKSVLKPYIDKEKITVLYISIDKKKWKRKWKENMKFNQLEGYHVLADEILIKDMWAFLGGREGVIPRYAIVDKSGKIILSDAARPSNRNKLIDQLNKLSL